MTYISIIDRPCGVGKTTDLLSELKRHRIDNPDASILLVVPELGEIERFLEVIGEWFSEPLVQVDLDEDGRSRKKIDDLIGLLSCGKNVVTTHALYKSIRKFEHLLTNYHIVIDEVPQAAEEVRTNFGKGVFKHLLHEKKYIDIDPVTKLITVTSNWFMDADDYAEGTDSGISKFMGYVEYCDVYYVNDTYQVAPLPAGFFVKPLALTIMTFQFRGTQLNYFMRKQGYEYHIQTSNQELDSFKATLVRSLTFYGKHIKGKTGFTLMTGKNTQRRIQVGHFAKNTVKQLRKEGHEINPETTLVASHKDAWFGRELNPSSKVTNKTRLKSLTGLGKAHWTALQTRGTNKFRHCEVIFILGKLNMNPGLAEFLNMRSQQAQDQHALSELIQLIYRTRIRDGKSIILVTPDASILRLLEDFLRP